MRPRLSGAGIAVVALVTAALLGTACDDPFGPAGIGGSGAAALPADSPEAAARALFALDPEPTEETLSALFAGPADVSARVDLLDALDRLPRASAEAVAIAGTEPLETAGRVAVDVDLAVADGAVSRYSIQVAPAEDAGPDAESDDEAQTWRIVWFQGPDLGWPAYRAPRGTGTSVSAPPGGDRDG